MDNYRNYATTVTDIEQKDPITPEDVNAPESTPDPEPTVEPTIGVVSGTKKLNVRAEPSLDSEIVCVLSKDSKVMIDLEQSTDDWFNVYTEAGLDGYCMSDYVTIEE